MTFNKNYIFFWKKIFILRSVAAFNKGISGEGYGPIVTGGQLLSGIKGNHAVGITSLAEGLTCIVGVIIFVASPESIDWSLAPSLIIGALFSVPFCTFIVKNFSTKIFKISIGTLTFLLGVVTLIKVFYF